jgi:hypothetical protein
VPKRYPLPEKEAEGTSVGFKGGLADLNSPPKLITPEAPTGGEEGENHLFLVNPIISIHEYYM